MISYPLEDLRCRRGMAWSVFWKLETVRRLQSLSLETKLRLFDSLVLTVLIYGAKSWSVSAQMKHLINSFATLLHSTRSTTTFTWSHAMKQTISTCQYFRAIPAKSWHNKTWPPSTKLRGPCWEVDWNEDRRTDGGVTRSWSRAWTCGCVHWPTTMRLQRGRESTKYTAIARCKRKIFCCLKAHQQGLKDIDSHGRHVPRALLDETVAGLPGTGVCSVDRTLLAGDAATSSVSSIDVEGFLTGSTSSATMPSTFYTNSQW